MKAENRVNEIALSLNAVGHRAAGKKMNEYRN